MKLIISPYVSVGPIRLGTSREEIRRVLSNRPVEFQKSALSPCSTDDFREWHLHVFYRDDYRCNAVELWRGSNPVLRGHELLSTKYIALLDEFRKLDSDLEVDVSSFISRKFGISIYSPAPFEPPASVMVAERGYWD